MIIGFLQKIIGTQGCRECDGERLWRECGGGVAAK